MFKRWRQRQEEKRINKQKHDAWVEKEALEFWSILSSPNIPEEMKNRLLSTAHVWDRDVLHRVLEIFKEKRYEG